VFDQLFPSTVLAETTYPQHVIDHLLAKGHNVTSMLQSFTKLGYAQTSIVWDILESIAAVQGVMEYDGRITAASDSRKWGVAAGY
jgi:gamma-glutamyltranspeptidase / glutathione hydrolase / leukotriene-C4 hydrolase